MEEPFGRDQSQAQVEAFMLQKAELLAVDAAGTYISSLQLVKQGQRIKNQVKALASSFLQTEIGGNPQIRSENGMIFMKVKSRAQVDTTVLAPQVVDIAVRLRAIALNVRPPGVETPGYYLSSLAGLIVSYWHINLFV